MGKRQPHPSGDPGRKAWQFRYRHGGKPQTYTVGKVSKTQGLAWARGEADKAGSRVGDGDRLTRVKAVRKAAKRAAAANTFGIVSADWVGRTVIGFVRSRGDVARVNLHGQQHRRSARRVGDLGAGSRERNRKRSSGRSPDLGALE